MFDLFRDMALAKARPGTPLDPEEAAALESRTFRRRIASVAWLPGLAVALTLGSWTGSAIVAGISLVIILAAVLLYAERGDRIAARIRRSRN
jgi:hypothetical protein